MVSYSELNDKFGDCSSENIVIMFAISFNKMYSYIRMYLVYVFRLRNGIASLPVTGPPPLVDKWMVFFKYTTAHCQLDETKKVLGT